MKRIMALVAFVAGCSTGPSQGGSDIQILLNNSTGRSISVQISGPGFSTRTEVLGSGEFVSDEYPGGVGDAITITAATSSGSVANGTNTCRPKETIVSTASSPKTEYGQVDFGLLSATQIDVRCQDTGTWQP